MQAPGFEEFRRCLDDTFVADVGGQRLTFVLASVDVCGPPAVAGRTPFSLVFLGPATPLLPQGTYLFAHQRFVDLAIFIVPIGRDGAGVHYEALFT